MRGVVRGSWTTDSRGVAAVGALAAVLGIAALAAAAVRFAERSPAQSRPAAQTSPVPEPAVPDPRQAEPVPAPAAGESPESMLAEPIRWRRSVALGRTNAGRLVRAVQLPSEGEHFFTWDPIRRTTPNRGWRRHGTDRLVRVLLRVLGEFRAAHPGAPRVGVGDLSRPRGGDFGPRFGRPGHASHENGLDADVYYPRRDGRERGAAAVGQVDRALAQDLVDRFVRAGARFAFVGTLLGLRGDRRIVQAIPNHNDHVHVRLWPRPPR
jgi:murein endopeptidase